MCKIPFIVIFYVLSSLVTEAQLNSKHLEKTRIRRWDFPKENNSFTIGNPCEIKSKSIIKKGICKKVAECSTITPNQIRQQQPPTCYYNGTEPIICCLNTSEKNKTQSLQLEKLILPGCGMKPLQSNTGHLSFARKRRGSYKPVVVGGHESIKNSWPWMLAVLRKTTSNKFIYHCGASLISERYSISAAHCFVGGKRSSNPADYNVRVGAHNRQAGIDYSIETIIVHERYKQKEHYFDIALLKSSKQIRFSNVASPICLPPKGLKLAPETRATVTGWGDTSFGGTDSPSLQEASIEIFTNKKCNDSYKKITSSLLPRGITSNMMCAGEKLGGKDACQGDSGGPLVFLDKGGWTQIGIVSFGYGCAQAGFPGVYTRVSHYVTWIASKTKNLDGAGKTQ